MAGRREGGGDEQDQRGLAQGQSDADEADGRPAHRLAYRPRGELRMSQADARRAGDDAQTRRGIGARRRRRTAGRRKEVGGPVT